MILSELLLSGPSYFYSVKVLLFLTSFVGAITVIRRQANRTELPDFQGPPGVPIFGNLRALATNGPEKCRRWATKHGDVLKLHLGNIPVLVVNSAAAAKQIFQSHSQNLGSRPSFYTHHQVIAKTSGVIMGTAPYSSSLNKSRKHIGTILSKPAVAGYVHHLDLETQSFVEQCLQLGQGGAKAIDPLRLIRRMLLSLNLTLCYGRRVSLDDPILDEIAHVEHGLVNMRNTIHTLQDCIPVLQLNPFSAETRTAKQLRQRRDDYFTGLNKELDERRANGTDTPCIRSALLDQPDIDSKQVQLTCLTFVSAGMAPTSATLQWSIAMLAHRPDIQLAAFNALQDHYRQDEALAQMGTAYDDQTCVYIVALVKEFLRFFSVAPFSLPHSTTKDFVYDGKPIKAGTTIFLNAWACNRDPHIWPCSPDTFDPMRFMKNPNAPVFTFGIGYRACAGIPYANRVLYLFFVRLISAFEIVQVGEIDMDPLTGGADAKNLVNYMKPYKVLFKPREVSLSREVGSDHQGLGNPTRRI